MENTTEDVPGPNSLSSLITRRRGARTYVELSKDCGGKPTHKALQQMVTRRLKNFPDPDTIRGLARGLNVLESDVVEVCAREVGLRVGVEIEDSLVLAHARRLPASAQDALTAMSRELLKLNGLVEAAQTLAPASKWESKDDYRLAADKGQEGMSFDTEVEPE
ncbi:hypothetical protein [Paenarthrobacter ureafaciens]|uniref:hypothetical protein n=1 Tax=Paenarthrobacter ureafaciens TaxID=37931 RepID=UPI001FB4B3A9|nr:hypothetical protein [Paenarthrobacter ureafaciens]UOD80305.1 hypothetical protein MQZ73_14450 [Paenarthrobacter ureafaciens]WNZ04345.1 hypothetical protein PVT25_01940 [Paenarthrobacter ureafaciens]